MSRTSFPYHVGDISALARSLNDQLAARETPPGHVEMLNILARAGGYRNFQHFRAAARPADLALVEPVSAPSPSRGQTAVVIPLRGGEAASLAPRREDGAPRREDEAPRREDEERLRRLMRFFDAAGRLIRWPSKLNQQTACLWALWSRLPPRQVMTESEVNLRLQKHHLFGDYALLRRRMCDCGMMTRTTDGRAYRRIEQPPPADALALIRRLRLTTGWAGRANANVAGPL